MNFSMNYYLNVSLIGSSTKNDRCQDVTGSISIFVEFSIPGGNFYERFFKIIKKNYKPFKCRIILLFVNHMNRRLLFVIKRYSTNIQNFFDTPLNHKIFSFLSVKDLQKRKK